MPTTSREAENILRIATKYMSIADMCLCFTELDDKVGQKSDNDSVRQSFAMFRQLAEYALTLEKQSPTSSQSNRSLWYALLFFVTSFHIFLVIGNILAFFVLPFRQPWEVSFPACFAIIWVACSPVNCILTSWENTCRAKVGLPLVRSFIRYYFFRPVVWVWNLLHRKKEVPRDDDFGQSDSNNSGNGKGHPHIRLHEEEG